MVADLKKNCEHFKDISFVGSKDGRAKSISQFLWR
jgi:hypothetical protein